MTHAPYQVSEPDVPTLGLVALQTDESIETDFRRLFAPLDARIHVSRVASATVLSHDSIDAMADGLAAAAALLPPMARFASVAFACTSAATQIGTDRVARLVRDGVLADTVTDPLSAALAGSKALGLTRVGIVSPYIASIARPVQRAFEAAGIAVPHTLSFGEAEEAKVARIDPASIADAARALVAKGGMDGVFLSCTNLRTLDIVPALERDLGVAVLSSNLGLAWHMARSANVALSADIGRLGQV